MRRLWVWWLIVGMPTSAFAQSQESDEASPTSDQADAADEADASEGEGDRAAERAENAETQVENADQGDLPTGAAQPAIGDKAPADAEEVPASEGDGPPSEEGPADDADPQPQEDPSEVEDHGAETSDQGDLPVGTDQKQIGELTPEEEAALEEVPEDYVEQGPPLEETKKERRQRLKMERKLARQQRTAQQKAQGTVDGFRIANEIVDLYGSFRAQLAYYENRVDVQDNSSRFGIRAAAAIPNFVTIFGRAEWSVAFGATQQRLNLDASTTSGALEVQDEGSPFRTRLGVIGLDFAKGGRIAFGKQWSTYYDVSGFTDVFNVFGGRATGTYNAETDGGLAGTGRASNALSYRITIFDLLLGGQVQFFGDRPGIVDSLGVVAQYDSPIDLDVGAAYNHSFYSLDGDTQFEGLQDGDSGQALVIGARWGKYGAYLAATYTRTWNHEARTFGEGDARRSYFFDTDGIEFAAKYMWRHMVGGIIGYNGMFPRNKPAALNQDFAIHALILGGEYRFFRWARVYMEMQWDFGKGPQGEATPFSGTLGIRIDFSSQRALESLFQSVEDRIAAAAVQQAVPAK